MSKWPVTYYSESKKQDLEIDQMAVPHLANAWRKLGKEEKTEELMMLRGCLAAELVDRGCTFNAETDRWVFPKSDQKEEHL